MARRRCDGCVQLSYLVSVGNLGDQPEAVQLTDRLPVSESDEIKVSSVKITPGGKPDPKGLLRWDLKLTPKQKKEFRIEYTMEYPADLPTRGEATEWRRPAALTPLPSAAPTIAPPNAQAEQLRLLEKQLK